MEKTAASDKATPTSLNDLERRIAEMEGELQADSSSASASDSHGSDSDGSDELEIIPRLPENMLPEFHVRVRLEAKKERKLAAASEKEARARYPHLGHHIRGAETSITPALFWV